MTNFFQHIEQHRDFPVPGVVFFDFTTIHEQKDLLEEATSRLLEKTQDIIFDKIAAVEAKGFILGTAIALRTNKPLTLVRKPGLIPGDVLAVEFVKEYGVGRYEMKAGSVKPRERVLVVYDILAGPGATRAVIDLVEKQGGVMAAGVYVTELLYLGGREALTGYNLYSLVQIENKP